MTDRQHIVSNGTGLMLFTERHCAKCTRDAVEAGRVSVEDSQDSDWCPVLMRVVLEMRDAPEWRERPDGSTYCTEFLPPTPSDAEVRQQMEAAGQMRLIG